MGKNLGGPLRILKKRVKKSVKKKYKKCCGVAV
jgi:hypothetical protein